MPRPRAKRRARQRERLLLRLLRGGLRVVLLVAALDLGRFFFIFASYDERSSFGLGGALILYLIIDGDGDGGLIYEPATACETEPQLRLVCQYMLARRAAKRAFDRITPVLVGEKKPRPSRFTAASARHRCDAENCINGKLQAAGYPAHCGARSPAAVHRRRPA